VQSVQILLESLKCLQTTDNLKIFAYVVLENHLHLVASSNDIAKSIKKFNSYTAKELLALLQKHNVKTILDQLAFYKKGHKQ